MPIHIPTLGLILSVAAALATAGCKPTPPTAPAKDISPPLTARVDLPEEQRTPDLFGAWLVEAIEASDRQLRDQSWPMVALVGSRQIEIISQCVTIGPFDYTRNAGSIAVTRPSPLPVADEDAIPPPPQCTRSLSPAEQFLPHLLFSARDMKVQADGSVKLIGGEGSLVLRSPAGALDNPRGNTPPPRVPLLLGSWRFLSVDDRAVTQEAAMELMLRPQILEWRSGCVNEVRRLGRDGDTLLPGRIDPFPACQRGRSPVERAVGLLLSGRIATLMRADGRLTLTGSGVRAELTPFTH